MDDYESLSHSKWHCKYRVVFIPKCCRKTLYGELRQHLGEVFRRLAMQTRSKIIQQLRNKNATLLSRSVGQSARMGAICPGAAKFPLKDRKE